MLLLGHTACRWMYHDFHVFVPPHLTGNRDSPPAAWFGFVRFQERDLVLLDLREPDESVSSVLLA